MQEGYLHSLPKSNALISVGAQNKMDLMKHRRLAIVFRHGQQSLMKDSGKPAEILTAPAPITPEQRHPLGSMPDLLKEGDIYSRVRLAEMFAHR
jgi:hypothetical protein